MKSAVASLNVYKKVAIIRKSTDSLTYEDDEGNLKTISDLGDAASTSAPSTRQKPKHDIPTPRIISVDTYDKDVPSSYQIPDSYVRYNGPVQHTETDLEYVADAEDEAWLLHNTKLGSKNSSEDRQQKRPRLSLTTMERMMDIMEKETGFDAIITSDQAERLLSSRIPELLHLFPFKAPAGVVTVKHAINEVYTYWLQKRSKLKRPLLRRFWPVTATDDTNPHLVFRPREKEKYKLRKKRQNDMDAYRKMQQLRADFEKVQSLLKLVKRREELNRCMIQLQADLFEQRLYDIVDTSGLPRTSSRLQRNQVGHLLDVPKYFNPAESSAASKKRKRRKAGGTEAAHQAPPLAPSDFDRGTQNESLAVAPAPAVVAGQNHGEPAPNFLHPLRTRESYTTSHDSAVPFIPSYVNSHPTPTFRFRHRPRVGRGGRVCIDRVPRPAHPNITPETVFTAGNGAPRSLAPRPQLLDLLPQPLNHAAVSRNIEEICAVALKDDMETATGSTSATGASSASGAVTEAEENDCQEVLVSVSDWLDTDDQLWGEERFALGPI